MNLDLMSFLIGIFSSIIAVASVYFIGKVAKNNLSQKVMIFKNDRGRSIEIITENNSNKNIKSYFNDAIKYEKSVADIFRSLNFDVEEASLNSPDKGYDILLKTGDRFIAVEVKSHSKPLSVNVIRETLGKLPEDIDDALYISKNGFSKSSIDYIQRTRKNIALASGENGTLVESIKNALKSKGITSQKGATTNP